MNEQPQIAHLLTTPWMSSWVGRARPGDRQDHDPKRRSASWAHWAMSNIVAMTGASDRSYEAVVLEGRYHDPKGTGPLVRPHLEIPERILGQKSSAFPDRLAQLGNGISGAWWLYPEVTAAKRALFTALGGDVNDLVAALNERRPGLVEMCTMLAERSAPRWQTVESLLVTAPDGLSGDACGDFSEEEVAAFLPVASEFRLRVTFDPKLRDVSQGWASRRVGIWRLEGVDVHGLRFSLGVVTPRLTMNSQFHDPLFAFRSESPAALLVRGLQLRRLGERHLKLGASPPGTPSVVTHKPAGHLKAVPSKVGSKLPEASVEAAHAFLVSQPEAEGAWTMLSNWSTKSGTLLTVVQDGFIASHKRAMRFVRRGEAPERDDINVLLPIGWDSQSRVVRVTYVRSGDTL